MMIALVRSLILPPTMDSISTWILSPDIVECAGGDDDLPCTWPYGALHSLTHHAEVKIARLVFRGKISNILRAEMVVVDLVAIITAYSAFTVTMVAHNPGLVISLATSVTGAVVLLLMCGVSVQLGQLVWDSATCSRVRVRPGLGLISGHFESNCIEITQLYLLFLEYVH